MKTATLIRYALAALAVIILGALAGWYFFLRSQIAATMTLNAGRGFSTQVPGGGAGSTDNPLPSSGSVGSSTPAVTAPAQLWHISASAAGGIGFATSTEGTRVRYAERATGHVFEADPTNGSLTRLTNSLMPKNYETYFAPFNRIIERSLDTGGAVTTFAGIIPMSATSSTLTGVSLPGGIEAVAPDPKSAQLFYVQSRGNGVVGITSAWNGSKQKQIFSSAVSDWRAWWLSDGRIILAQKASDGLSGYAYTLKNASLEGLLGPLPGLTVLPRAGSSALLYGTSSGGLALFVRVSATTTGARLPISTVADKCVWLPGATLIAYCAVPQGHVSPGFLDAWYRGETHTSDSIWRVDARTGQAQLIFTPPSDIALDVINPTMDESGAYIAFMNAADESPWLLRLNK